MAEKSAGKGINAAKFPPRKSGPVRQAGQLPGGDGSTSRSGGTAKAGTLASSRGDGDGGTTYKASFAEGTKQKFRPTPGRGSVR